MASIKQRGENSYQITVSSGYNAAGKKIIHCKKITLDTGLSPKKIEQELQKQAALFEREVETGTYMDGGKVTFAEFTDRWFKDYAEKQLQPKTLHRYKDLLDSRIIPAIGHVKLNKLQPTHLMKFYNNLQETGIRKDVKYSVKPGLLDLIKQANIKIVDLARMVSVSTETIQRIKKGSAVSHKTAEALSKVLKIKMEDYFVKQDPGILSGQTVKHHHQVISSILTCAVQWQIIFNNPAIRVKPPKVEKTEAGHLEEEITEKLLSLLDNEPLKYKVMIYVAVYSGGRLGEIAGLEWSDINFENNLIRICRSSQYIPGKGIITKSPKNKSSERIIAMPQLVMDLLREYRVWQNEERLKCGDLWEDNDRLFTKWNGLPIFPHTITTWFKEFRRRHNLPEIKFHGLRHTNASLLIGQGVNIQTVAKRLGHTKATTTTSVYSHFLKRPDTEAAEILQNLFNKDKSNTKKA